MLMKMESSKNHSHDGTTQLLGKDERLQLRVHPHWVVLTRSMLWAMGCVAIAALLGYAAKEWAPQYAQQLWTAAAASVVAGAAIVAVSALKRSMREVIVTDRRVVVSEGMLSRSILETRLNALQSTGVDQHLVGRLLHFGTVTLETGNDDPMVLRDVPFPLELHSLLQEHVRPREEAPEGASVSA